jgi:hypothetical protein
MRAALVVAALLVADALVPAALVNVAIGAIAGGTGAAVVFPADLVKTRMQAADADERYVERSALLLLPPTHRLFSGTPVGAPTASPPFSKPTAFVACTVASGRR